MSTISDIKALVQAWTGIYLWDCTTKDGVTHYFSTHVITFNGHSYEAIILSHSAPKVDMGIYGIDVCSEISLVINNADANQNPLIAPTNWQGAIIIGRFIFFDPATRATTTDSKVFGRFLADLPTATWPRVEVTAHNVLNFARKTLPISVITRKDRYPFPSTAAEREAAYSDPSSPFYAIGYSPEHGHGNWKDPENQIPYTDEDYNGTRDTDGDDGSVSLKTIGLEARFGGFGKCPPTVTYSPQKGQSAEFKGSANEAKYGQPVPLVFGTCRIAPIVLDTGSPTTSPGRGSGARASHLLLSDGANFSPDPALMGIEDVLDVWMPAVKDGKAYRVPKNSNEPGATGSWSFVGGYYGSQLANDPAYRNIDSALDYFIQFDFTDRDLYSGLAFLSIGYPKELASATSEAGPKTEAVVKGLKLEAWDRDGNSDWKWTDSPVWIMVHLLKLLGWKTSDMDKAAIYDAAAYCAETITGKFNGHERFRCNLALVQATKAADMTVRLRRMARTCVRGVRGYSLTSYISPDLVEMRHPWDICARSRHRAEGSISMWKT